jgi:hypothetical protein
MFQGGGKTCSGMGSKKYLKRNLLNFVFMPHALTLHSVYFERIQIKKFERFGKEEEGRKGESGEW